jgi:ribosomal protein L22
VKTPESEASYIVDQFVPIGFPHLQDAIANAIRRAADEEREACAKICADQARQLREAIPFAKGETARYLECQARVLEDVAEDIRSRA